MREARQFGIVFAVVLAALIVGWALGGSTQDLLESSAMLVGGIYLLIKGADLLVHGAVRLARAVGVSPFFIGVTVVAFGTSAPELAASIGATLENQGDLAVGNVLGSNVANICLILGATALVRTIPVNKTIARVDTPIMMAITALAIIPMLDAMFRDGPGVISRLDGLILTIGLVAFIAYNAATGRVDPDEIEHQVDVELNEDAKRDRNNAKLKTILRDVGFILIGLAGLVIGARLLVVGAVDIATRLSVPSVIVGLTVVAIGTSVPELAFSLRAALKGHPEIALGNVVGSNVFNLLCVLGIASLVRPIPVPPEAVDRDVWVMLAITVLLWPVMLSRNSISRFEGGVMLALYAGYMVWVSVAR
jgi:cation:H+ antiporter